MIGGRKIIKGTYGERTNDDDVSLESLDITAPACGDPELAVDGNVKVNGYTVGATSVYSCNKGFLLKGSHAVKCGEHGWEGEPPSCILSKKNIYCVLIQQPMG